jgi:Transcriptional regulator DsbA
MPKNQLAVPGGKKRQFADIEDIVKNPAQRSKLQNYIDEAVRHKIKILDENEMIKSVRDAAIEELSIPPKVFNLLVGVYFNNNFDEKKIELESGVTAIECMQLNQGPTLTHEKDEDEDDAQAA